MGYRIGYNGPQVDDLLQKGYKYSVINNGWTKLESSDLAATNLDTLVTPGNYSTSFWQNGPIQLVTNGPINVCVTKDSSSNTLYQTIYDAGKIYIRSTTSTSFSNTWKEEQNNSSLDIGASTPVNPSDNYIWIDTSGDAPVIKIYKENRGEWVAISAADLAKKSVYDKNDVGKPFTTYLDEQIAEGDLATAENTYKKHIVEGEDTGNPIHVTSEEKLKWNAGISTSEADTLINNFKKDMQSYADEKVNTSSTKINDLTTEVNEQKKIMDNHMGDNTIHLTADQVTAFDNKAAGDHTHLNDGTVTVSTTNLTGLIPIERLDPNVLERNYTVSSYDDLFNLTKNEVQNGDSIYVSGKPIVNAISTNMPSTRTWVCVCYGAEKFVVVASYSNIFAYSTDGINWTEGTMPSKQTWMSVCYGNDKFVATTNGSVFAYSEDGITWTQGTMPSDQNWRSVCYGNDKFVTVSYYKNKYAYSEDGITWTQGNMPNTRQWYQVCYGNDKFVAVAYEGIFAYSTDGITWTEGTMPSSLACRSVCYANNKFVAVANGSKYAYSTDGITWTEGTMPKSVQWISVCYGDKKFVAISGNTSQDFAYSEDGITWTLDTLPVKQSWQSVCYGNGKFVAIASSITSSYIKITIPSEKSKPSAWFVVDDSKLGEYELASGELKTGLTGKFYDIAYGNNIWVAAMYDTTVTGIVLYYSKNAIDWIRNEFILDRLYSEVIICYANNKFVAIGSYKSLSNESISGYSTDGINWTWTQFTSPFKSSFVGNHLCYNNGVYVSTSSKNFGYSTDGINWKAGVANSLSANDYSWLCTANNYFIAMDNGVIVSTSKGYYVYSTDGINWTEGSIDNDAITSITYGDGKYVATGGRYIYYSYDLITWVSISYPYPRKYSNLITFVNNMFIAICFGTNYFYYSNDGINWNYNSQPEGYYYYCAYDDNKNILVGVQHYLYNSTGYLYMNLNKLPTALVQYAAPTPELTWDNITNKPTTISDYGLSNTYYTADEINALYNKYKTQYDEINKSVSDITDSLLEIPEDLSTTYDTNLARASELNKKLDDLLHSLGLNDKMISDMVNMYKERSIIYRSSLDTEIDFDSLTVGSTFFLGKYQVESEDPWDIEWEIVHQTDDYQIAMTKQVIDLRCFDAKEPTNTDSDRKDIGNNNWQYSNIKQFLNSDQASWYSAQHEYDAPPTSANCYSYANGTTYNAYDTHKGFLYYWSADEKSLLKDYTFALANNTVTDGGGSYTWTGKVWLPTITQMGDGQNNGISEGEVFSKFTTYTSRIKSLHPNCAANNECCKVSNYASGKNHHYWLSSASYFNSAGANGVNSIGQIAGGDGVYSGYVGLAPCICLPRTGKFVNKTHDPSQKTVAIKYSYTNLSSDNLPTEVVNNKPTGESFTFDILTDSNKSYTHNIDDTHYPSGQVVDADDGSGYWTFSGWNTDDATIK